MSDTTEEPVAVWTDVPENFPTHLTEDFRKDILNLMTKHGFGDKWISAHIDSHGVSIELPVKIGGKYVLSGVNGPSAINQYAQVRYSTKPDFADLPGDDDE